MNKCLFRYKNNVRRSLLCVKKKTNNNSSLHYVRTSPLRQLQQRAYL